VSVADFRGQYSFGQKWTPLVTCNSIFLSSMPILSPHRNSWRLRLAINTISGDTIVNVLIVAVLTALAIRGLAWNYVKRLAAGGWTTGQGTIEFGSVEQRRTRYGSYYVARIDYSYSVNGEYFSGYLERVFIWESSADKFVAAMKGHSVFVRSNPSHPERSALLKEDQPGGWPA
jgi:Protein of unknown function (DUF3592)